MNEQSSDGKAHCVKLDKQNKWRFQKISYFTYYLKYYLQKFNITSNGKCL